MATLPSAENAVIAVEKIRDYVLNPDHADGYHKARVIMAATGLRRTDYKSLISQIKHGIMLNEAMQHDLRRDRQQYYVEMPITGPKGTIVVRTIWIYEERNNGPKLTTLYPTRRPV
jgi:hypothetical protein